MAGTVEAGCHIGAAFQGLDWASTRREMKHVLEH
jgi:hypothetical protein